MHHKKWKNTKKNAMKHDIIKYQTWLSTKFVWKIFFMYSDHDRI